MDAGNLQYLESENGLAKDLVELAGKLEDMEASLSGGADRENAARAALSGTVRRVMERIRAAKNPEGNGKHIESRKDMQEIINLMDQMVCEGCTECSRNDNCLELSCTLREVRKEQIGSSCSLSLCGYRGPGICGYLAVFRNQDYPFDPLCVAITSPEKDNVWHDAAFAKALTEVSEQMEMRLEEMNASHQAVCDAITYFSKS